MQSVISIELTRVVARSLASGGTVKVPDGQVLGSVATLLEVESL